MPTAPPSPPKTWLITGCSSGLGLAIALAALRAGHSVIACARTPDRARAEHPELEELGGRWAELDVAREDAQRRVEAVVRQEEQKEGGEDGDGDGGVGEKGKGKGKGGIDVVVNNAGYALQGTVEDLSEDEMSAHLAVTFFGAVRVLKAVLPHMRSRRSGTVVNMSSIVGFAPQAESQMYGAAKAALESMSESYASLLAPFGIRVVILEPGAFRTKLAEGSRSPAAGMSEDYGERMERWLGFVEAVKARPEVVKGDPDKLGARVVEFVDGTGMSEGLEKRGRVLRLLLGADCLGMWKERFEGLQENLREMEDRRIPVGMDVDE